MFIRIDDRQDGNDRYLQGLANEFASSLLTEDAVQASYRDLVLFRALVGRVVLFAAASLVVDILAACFLNSSLFAVQMELALGTVLVLILIYGVPYRSDTAARIRLFDPIVSNNDLCAKVVCLASHSRSVTDYVRNARKDERQLRIFDVARINLVYEAEQHTLARHYGNDACAALHSL